MTGRIAVGGITRTDALVLIRVLGARPEPGLAAKTLATLEKYQKGLAAYRDMDWDRAIEYFIKALDISINDGPSKTMMARCNHFKQNPPNSNWNRAFTITSN